MRLTSILGISHNQSWLFDDCPCTTRIGLRGHDVISTNAKMIQQIETHEKNWNQPRFTTTEHNSIIRQGGTEMTDGAACASICANPRALSRQQRILYEVTVWCLSVSYNTPPPKNPQWNMWETEVSASDLGAAHLLCALLTLGSTLLKAGSSSSTSK